jgi:hypothetical protein
MWILSFVLVVVLRTEGRVTESDGDWRGGKGLGL